jgi:putative PEP-CTERM system TPR-repeat lipoprotein
MKRTMIIVATLLVGSVVAVYFLDAFSNSATKRERHLKAAREYVAKTKLNEAEIEFRNALKLDPAHAESHFELGVLLMRRGDIKRGLVEIVRAVDLKPDWAQARFQLAKYHALFRDMTSAKRHLKILREQSPNSFESRYLAASLALAENDLETAQKELEKIVDKEPERAQTYIDLGDVFIRKRNLKAAETHYRKALAIDPKLAQARVSIAKLHLLKGDRKSAEGELLSATRDDPENESLLHVLGSFYQRSRHFDDVEKIYLEFLKKKPESIAAKKRLAEVYILKKDFKSARYYADAVLKIEATDPNGLFFRGWIYLEEGNTKQAVADLVAALRNRVRFGPGFYLLGLAQTRNGQFEDAKKSLTWALDIAPHWPAPTVALAKIHAAQGNLKIAQELSDKVLQRDPENFEALLISGTARLKNSEFEKALVLFRRAQKQNAADPAPRTNIAAAYMLQKKYSNAIKEYEAVLEIDPERIDALKSIAQIHSIQGTPQLAFERAERHLMKTKNQGAVYELMGRQKLAGKDYAAGIQLLEKAIERNHDLVSAYYTIGSAYAAQGKFDVAIDQYQKVSAKHPKMVAPLMMAAILYELKKDHRKANENYQKILDLDKNFTAAANNLAWNYAQYGGNLDVALTLAQKAREANPNDPGIADTLGWIYYKKGIYQTALSLLKESNEKYGGQNATVLYHLSLALEKNNEKSLAQETVKKALMASQGFAEVDDAKKLRERLQAAGYR